MKAATGHDALRPAWMPSRPVSNLQRPMRWQYCCAMPASLELVKIALQAYGNGDCEIALGLAAPLIRWDERASRPDGDLIWGHDEVQRAMRRYLDGWEQYRFELEDVAEVGPGKVVGICREQGKPKEGSAVDRRFGGLWVVEHSKIVSWATYLTPKEAVRAAKELEQDQIRPVVAPTPAPMDTSGDERPSRKRALTKSEEQKRAARARAKLRRSSRQTA